jgi:hypothetical protein
VNVTRNKWQRQHVASLWGIDANIGKDSKHINEYAAELVAEAIETIAAE